MKKTLVTLLVGAFLGILAGCAPEAAGPSATTPLVPAEEPAGGRYTYITVIADTHVEEADGSAANHLRALGQNLVALPYDPEGVFVLGDVTYEIDYTTWEEYEADPADGFDVAQQIFETFPAPVWPLIGNHDLDVGDLPQDLTHRLFKKHFGTDPYYAVDLGTWKILVLDNFKGPTLDLSSPEYDYDSGSLGAEQTAWMESQLSDGRPAVLMLHFPLFIMPGLPEVLARHTDTIRLVISGHSHTWINLSDNYSVPHLVVGGALFDADSFLILQLDNVLKTWRILNWSDFHWGSAFALPSSSD